MEKNETTRVLDAIERVIFKHVSVPTQEERDAIVLWTAASWVIDSFDAFPRLYFRSSSPGSGKSMAMKMVLQLSRDHEDIVQPSAAVIYRVFDMSDQKITIGIDEADMCFGRAGSSSKNTDVLTILNRGYECDGTVLRARGQNDVARFKVYGPITLAGMGVLPPALLSRSITINMRKPVEGESYTPYRRRVHSVFFDSVKEALDKWSGRAGKSLGNSFPELPPEVKNRDAQLFEPLIMVADLADDSDWGERARKAAVYFSTRADVTEAVPAGTQFVKTLARMLKDTDRVTQADVASELGWTKHQVGKLAREMELPPLAFKKDGKTYQGFRRELFQEMFNV